MLQEGVALDEPGGPAEGAAELRLERFSIESLHPPILFLGLARITPTPTRPIEGAGVCFSGLPLMGEGRGGGDHRDAIWSETVLAAQTHGDADRVDRVARTRARLRGAVRLDRTDAKLHFALLRRQPRQGETLPRPAAPRLEGSLG